MDDPYLYPGTRVLKNNFNIQNLEVLDKIEYHFSNDRRIAILEQFKKFPPKLNQKTHQEIHKKLFGDVYEWAGETRRINLSKSFTVFADYNDCNKHFKMVLDALKKENYLKDIPVEKMPGKLAQYYNALNYIHAYREGNGRTNEIFINEVIRKTGLKVDFKRVRKSKFIGSVKSAMKGISILDDMKEKLTIESFKKNTQKLEECFLKMIEKSTGLTAKQKRAFKNAGC